MSTGHLCRQEEPRETPVPGCTSRVRADEPGRLTHEAEASGAGDCLGAFGCVGNHRPNWHQDFPRPSGPLLGCIGDPGGWERHRGEGERERPSRRARRNVHGAGAVVGTQVPRWLTASRWLGCIHRGAPRGRQFAVGDTDEKPTMAGGTPCTRRLLGGKATTALRPSRREMGVGDATGRSALNLHAFLFVGFSWTGVGCLAWSFWTPVTAVVVVVVVLAASDKDAPPVRLQEVEAKRAPGTDGGFPFQCRPSRLADGGCREHRVQWMAALAPMSSRQHRTQSIPYPPG